MNFLLKIVEGPMKGAEIALVAGLRLKVGRGDACDIVLADATLPELAFELEVSETGVMLIRTTGEMVAMRPFEMQDFGTTSIAIGPAEGAWEPLTRPEPPAPNKEEEPAEVSPEEMPAPTESAETAETTEPPASTEASEPEKADEQPKKRRSFLVLLLLLLSVVLLAGIAALWFLWGRNIDWRNFDFAKEKARILGPADGKGQVPCTQKAPSFDLALLVKKHGLVLGETNGVKTLSGNLQHRAERLALRALVQANDPFVRFDLTDNETMTAAANETLLACADGAIKAVSTTNRVVMLEGFAPSPEALGRVLRVLNADVRGIAKLDTARVVVGGTAPEAVAETPFVQEVQSAAGPSSAMSETGSRPAARLSRRVRGGAGQDYPIAGILMVPYPCVIMRDGSRLMEGAQIGGAKLEKIEANYLTLKEGSRTIEWRP